MNNYLHHQHVTCLALVQVDRNLEKNLVRSADGFLETKEVPN